MATSSAQVLGLVRYGLRGDEDSLRTVALQIAAKEARAGHTRVAQDIKRLLDEPPAPKTPHLAEVAQLRVPDGSLDELTSYSRPTERLNDLVASSSLTRQLERIIAEHKQSKVLQLHGFLPSHRFLLEGPPGTGKTMTARVIASELSLPLRTIRLDSLFSRYMGQTAMKLRTIFEGIEKARGVYLFDEIDALAADRAGNDVGEARRVLNSLLVFLEEVSSDSLIIAATNHRSLLDRAMFRRFDGVLTYELPDREQVSALVRHRLGTLISDLDLAELWKHAEGLSHADVLKAAEASAKTAIMSHSDSVPQDELFRQLTVRRSQSYGAL